MCRTVAKAKPNVTQASIETLVSDAANVRRKMRPGKHCYLMPLDPEMRACVQHLAKPYPKRAGTIGSDGPAVQAG